MAGELEKAAETEEQLAARQDVSEAVERLTQVMRIRVASSLAIKPRLD